MRDGPTGGVCYQRAGAVQKASDESLVTPSKSFDVRRMNGDGWMDLWIF
jgi:hypothetical protein